MSMSEVRLPLNKDNVQVEVVLSTLPPNNFTIELTDARITAHPLFGPCTPFPPLLAARLPRAAPAAGRPRTAPPTPRCHRRPFAFSLLSLLLLPPFSSTSPIVSATHLYLGW